jgi:hypothetical protein
MKINLGACVRWIVLSLGILLPLLGAPSLQAAGDDPPPAAAAHPPSKIRSAEDGWLDLSGFLDEKYGFIPLVIPITEPAVGYGAAGALAFIDKPFGKAEAGFGRPNITAVGGLGTARGIKRGLRTEPYGTKKCLCAKRRTRDEPALCCA